MMQRPARAMLPDGKRVHFHHGPIDLIIEAEGITVRGAYEAAWFRFQTILDELVSELPLLRTEVFRHGLGLQGKAARTMERAVQPFWHERVTPMAAVAGSVAQHVLAAMTETSDLQRAYVNNGGDIALHLAKGEEFTIAAPSGRIVITQEDNAAGIATSGWGGRSFSLGIADAVTVLARTAAEADVAATLIANHVDLPRSPKVKREPARDLAPDSDLCNRLVTVDVSSLTETEIEQALAAGTHFAERVIAAGRCIAASLSLQGRTVTTSRTTELAHA
jgi:uncharacterized protein